MKRLFVLFGVFCFSVNFCMDSNIPQFSGIEDQDYTCAVRNFITGVGAVRPLSNVEDCKGKTIATLIALIGNKGCALPVPAEEAVRQNVSSIVGKKVALLIGKNRLEEAREWLSVERRFSMNAGEISTHEFLLRTAQIPVIIPTSSRTVVTHWNSGCSPVFSPSENPWNEVFPITVGEW
jgi:hypothetical protein